MSDVPLREHLESKIIALEKASEEAKKTLERRLEGMNEFRAQLKDQAQTFITRSEYCARNEKIDGAIQRFSDHVAEEKGKASQTSVIVSIVIAVAGLVLALAAILIDHVL
jgi:hypothetical protein